MISGQHPALRLSGCYGHPTLETPCQDALAAGGLRFTMHGAASGPGRATNLEVAYARRECPVETGRVLAGP